MRKKKITNSLGIKDIFRTARRNKWYNIGRPVTEKEFYLIVNKVNDKLAYLLSTGAKITIPHRMGELYITNYNPKVKLKDGKLDTNLPIDWLNTKKLWKEDEDSYRDRILVRYELPKIYKTMYSKRKALYINKSFYRFSVCRNFKKRLSENIINNKIIMSYKYDK